MLNLLYLSICVVSWRQYRPIGDPPQLAHV